MKAWWTWTLGVVLCCGIADAKLVNWRGAIYRGHLSDRPLIKDASPPAFFVADDCAGDPCTAGGASMPCVFQDDGSTWQQIVCGSTTTTTTTTTSTTTTTVTTTTVATTTTAASTTTTVASTTSTT